MDCVRVGSRRERAAARVAASRGPAVIRRIHRRHSPSDGTFTLEGEGWPAFKGTWKADGGEIELLAPNGPNGCTGPGRYRFRVDDRRLSFDLVSDDCAPRRMILDRSTWRPAGEAKVTPVRKIERTVANRTPLRAKAGDGAGNWPSFRGPQALGIAEKQMLPDTWNVTDRRAHPVAHADSRPRALESDRVGRSRVRDDRDQQPAERDLSSRTLRRRRRLGRSIAPAMGDLRGRQADGKDSVGARGPRRRAAQQAAHQVHLRERESRHRRPDRRRLVRIGGRVRLRPRRHAAMEGRSRPRRHGRVRHPDVRVGSGELADHLE